MWAERGEIQFIKSSSQVCWAHTCNLSWEQAGSRTGSHNWERIRGSWGRSQGGQMVHSHSGCCHEQLCGSGSGNGISVLRKLSGPSVMSLITCPTPFLLPARQGRGAELGRGWALLSAREFSVPGCSQRMFIVYTCARRWQWAHLWWSLRTPNTPLALAEVWNINLLLEIVVLDGFLEGCFGKKNQLKWFSCLWRQDWGMICYLAQDRWERS